MPNYKSKGTCIHCKSKNVILRIVSYKKWTLTPDVERLFCRDCGQYQ